MVDSLTRWVFCKSQMFRFFLNQYSLKAFFHVCGLLQANRSCTMGVLQDLWFI